MREPVKTNLIVKDCPYRKRGDKCIHSQIIKVRKHIHCHLQVRYKLAGVSIQECYVKSSARGFDTTYREVTVKDRIRF